MISESDIQIRYSGGSFNDDPSASLGGLMSPAVVPGGSLDSLFESLDAVDSPSITIREYRAIYVHNNSEIDGLYDITTWIDSEFSDVGGTTVKIGIPLQIEVQHIIISDSDKITTGDFTLKFGPHDLLIVWAGDSGTGENIRSALAGLPGLHTTAVITTSGITSVGYEITFSGTGRNKWYPALEVADNRLIAGNGSAFIPEISPSVVNYGSPINDIATDIAFGNNPPAGVSFITTSEGVPISVGNLRPQESFYIWVEREITLTTLDSYFNDGFTLKLCGDDTDLKLTTLTYEQLIQLTYPIFNTLPY